jgi:transposase
MTEGVPHWEYPLREVFHGLRWSARAGTSWRMLPTALPPREAFYQPTQRERSAGVLAAMVSELHQL